MEMRKGIVLTLLVLFALAEGATAQTIDTRIQESRTVVNEFMQELKTALQDAMKAGGPVNAIKVCRVIAPEIARRQSERHGWTMRRTSLKLRNPANVPDAWERETMLSFEKRKLDGEDISNMERAEEVVENGTKRFRYMKAIPTMELCTKCHGANIAAEVEAQLNASYPEDKARGFKAGDIRGAFTIIQPM